VYFWGAMWYHPYGKKKFVCIGDNNMKEIAIILACVPLYVINSFCDKYVSAKSGGAKGFFYNCVKFFVCALILVPFFVMESAPRFEWGAVLCGAGCGVMYAVSKTIMLEGYEKSSVPFMSFCHAAGMILPCVIGHFFWGETMKFTALCGMLLAVVSVVLLKGGKSTGKKWEKAGIVIGVIVFLMSGGVMIMQKLMGLYFTGQSAVAFNLYSFVVAFGAIACFVRTETPAQAISKKKLILCASASAVSLCVISLVMTQMSGVVPSVIMFPLFNGLGIIAVSLGSIAAFKEKMTPGKIAGLFVGVLGLCLINL